MRLGTRLLLTLLPLVTLIMIAYGGWALAQREQLRVRESRQEAEAYATALGLAFDYSLRDVQQANVQEIINQVSRAPTVYGVLIYDSTGRRTFVSDPLQAPDPPAPELLAGVLRTGETAAIEREIEGQRVFSVFRALRRPGEGVSGALEVAQPLAFIEEEKALVRRRFALNTVSLLLALTAATLWLVRRVVARPMERLVDGARAIGRGELAHRIREDTGGGELAALAREFNGMASSLEVSQAAVSRETEERLALERRLRETEKMAAIGNLAASLAHEIAAPLNVVSGRAELMVRRDPGPEARERNLRIIVQQISRITTIVRNLLDFAKRREPRLRPLDLSEVVDGVFEFLDHELSRAGVRVRREVARPVWVNGDPDLLHQLLVNLVLNAIQAMESVEGDRDLLVQVCPPGAEGRIILEMADSGPGIAPEALPRLFDPFFTTKPGGTGLGLVVARSIALEHGGSLEAENAAGRGGATFRCVLRAATPPESTDA